MKRREIREHAFKLIFAGVGDTLPTSASEHYFADNDIKGKDAAQIQEKVNGVFSNLEAVDSAIERNIKGYTFDRISKVSLAVLRLAVFEILFEEDIPDGVAISEALEIVSTYEDEKSKTFINGVLGAVSKEQ